VSPTPATLPTLALVGNPNVGKSVMFYNLTGRYVTVSNYPGSTIEVSRGRARVGETLFEVVDTPGMYSLMPITDEERVARRILLEGQSGVVLHLVDAKNISRMLPLTVQLLELGLPLVLVLNMMDEAERLQVELDAESLSDALGIPVVPTVAVARKGMGQLRDAITRVLGRGPPPAPVRHEAAVERALEEIGPLVPQRYQHLGRALALLLLQRDEEIATLVVQLPDLHPGQRGTIAYLYSEDQSRLNKLLTMGVLPGAEIELQRRIPTFVFRVGFSQFAVDHEVASAVYVRLES